MLFGLILSGVLFLIGTAGTEVYPAPTLPSFGGIPEQAEGAVAEWRVELRTLDGELERISIRDLFAQAPSSQFNNLVSGVLDNAEDPQVSAWFVDLVEQQSTSCTTEISLVRGEVNTQRLTFNGSCS